MRRVSVGAAALAAALLPGCAARPPAIVEAGGVVTLDGAPLPKAKVSFYPRFENASEYIAQGVTDADGRFTLTCNGQPGACAAESIVTVEDEDIPEKLTPEGARLELYAYLKTLKNRPIPPLYKTPAESPLKMTVTADQKEYRIELRR